MYDSHLAAQQLYFFQFQSQQTEGRRRTDQTTGSLGLGVINTKLGNGNMSRNYTAYVVNAH